MSIAFETGHPYYFENKFASLLSHLAKLGSKREFDKIMLKFEYKNYNDIEFDVIKRGPLLLFTIGVTISGLIFAIELIVFFTTLKLNA